MANTANNTKNKAYRLTLYFLFIFGLFGCTALFDQFVEAEKKVNNAAVRDSIVVLCEMASVGAIRREFRTPEQVETWQKLCADRADFEPINP